MPDLLTLTELINAARKLSRNELGQLADRINMLREGADDDRVAVKESRLLKKIHKDLPSKVKLRWHYLIAQRDAGVLTPQEHRELLSLTETMEEHDFKRLQWMGQLADLRQMSLPEVVSHYKIGPHNG